MQYPANSYNYVHCTYKGTNLSVHLSTWYSGKYSGFAQGGGQGFPDFICPPPSKLTCPPPLTHAKGGGAN